MQSHVEPVKSISAVVLNWKRPDNVKAIVDNWQVSGVINEALVWNNSPQKFTHEWATVINSSRDVGLYSRFAAAALTKNDGILIQDDDVQLPIASLRTLLDHWNNDRGIIHGVFGRRFNKDDYDSTCAIGDVPVILTRALMVHRRFIPKFFAAADYFKHIQNSSIPYGNGEDIIFSYSVRAESGRLNRAYDLEVVELPDPNSISNRLGHKAHRHKLMLACEDWLTQNA